MSTQIILKVLALRHRLRQRDRWTRQRLEAHQGRAAVAARTRLRPLALLLALPSRLH